MAFIFMYIRQLTKQQESSHFKSTNVAMGFIAKMYFYVHTILTRSCIYFHALAEMVLVRNAAVRGGRG